MAPQVDECGDRSDDWDEYYAETVEHIVWDYAFHLPVHHMENVGVQAQTDCNLVAVGSSTSQVTDVSQLEPRSSHSSKSVSPPSAFMPQERFVESIMKIMRLSTDALMIEAAQRLMSQQLHPFHLAKLRELEDFVKVQGWHNWDA